MFVWYLSLCTWTVNFLSPLRAAEIPAKKWQEKAVLGMECHRRESFGFVTGSSEFCSSGGRWQNWSRGTDPKQSNRGCFLWQDSQNVSAWSGLDFPVKHFTEFAVMKYHWQLSCLLLFPPHFLLSVSVLSSLLPWLPPFLVLPCRACWLQCVSGFWMSPLGSCSELVQCLLWQMNPLMFPSPDHWGNELMSTKQCEQHQRISWPLSLEGTKSTGGKGGFSMGCVCGPTAVLCVKLGGQVGNGWEIFSPLIADPYTWTGFSFPGPQHFFTFIFTSILPF